MGLSSSKILIPQPPPDKLSEFKKLGTIPDQYNIPEVSQKRVSTDVKCFIVFIVCLLIWFGFFIYTATYIDTGRWVSGFDTCGNICGRKNEPVSGLNCSGKDFENAKYLKFDTDDVLYNATNWYYYQRQCTEKCGSGYMIIGGHRCIPSDDGFEENSLDDFTLALLVNDTEPNNISKETKPQALTDEQLEENWELNENVLTSALGYTAAIALVSLIFCLLLLVLFRYATAAVVWTIVIGSYVILTIFVGSLWFSADDTTGIAITCSIVWIIVSFILFAFFKRIPLIINLFREATKAIFTMPGVIFTSLLTFVALFIKFVLFIIILFYLSNAGVLTQLKDNMYTYEPNGTMLFTMFFYIFLTLWIWNFIIGIQIMTIAGAVSSWYFARDKTFLGSPVLDSVKIVFKYHLGSIAFGSLVISVIKVVKLIISALTKNKKTRFFAEYCMRLFESVVVFISRNAYILTAMHGEDFMRSGKRAVQLIYLNINDVIALNSIGDFILFMAKLLVCIWSYYFCTLIYDSNSPIFLVGAILGILIAIILSNIIFSTFEIVIDTLMLCYCEDCCINDGIDRPYYMSTELMQFFEESKGVLNKTQEPLN